MHILRLHFLRMVIWSSFAFPMYTDCLNTNANQTCELWIVVRYVISPFRPRFDSHQTRTTYWTRNFTFLLNGLCRLCTNLGWKALMTNIQKFLFLRDCWTKSDGVFRQNADNLLWFKNPRAYLDWSIFFKVIDAEILVSIFVGTICIYTLSFFRFLFKYAIMGNRGTLKFYLISATFVQNDIISKRFFFLLCRRIWVQFIKH